MNKKPNRGRRFFVLALLLTGLLIAACTPTEPTSEPIAATIPQVLVFPGEPEKRLISDEKIEQNNCDGSAETSQMVSRQHTVQYTIEVGAGIAVSAEGVAGIPGIGAVGVGAEVATYYNVGYGRQESVSRAVTVAAKEGSHIQHTIQQFEVWETGELFIVVGNQNQRLPYSFRRDFSIEAVAPANIGCSIGAATETTPVSRISVDNLSENGSSILVFSNLKNGIEQGFALPNESNPPPSGNLRQICGNSYVETGRDEIAYWINVPNDWVVIIDSWKARWPTGSYENDGILIVYGNWAGEVLINTGVLCGVPKNWMREAIQDRRAASGNDGRPEFSIGSQ